MGIYAAGGNRERRIERRVVVICQVDVRRLLCDDAQLHTDVIGAGKWPVVVAAEGEIEVRPLRAGIGDDDGYFEAVAGGVLAVVGARDADVEGRIGHQIGGRIGRSDVERRHLRLRGIPAEGLRRADARRPGCQRGTRTVADFRVAGDSDHAGRSGRQGDGGEDSDDGAVLRQGDVVARRSQIAVVPSDEEEAGFGHGRDAGRVAVIARRRNRDSGCAHRRVIDAQGQRKGMILYYVFILLPSVCGSILRFRSAGYIYVGQRIYIVKGSNRGRNRVFHSHFYYVAYRKSGISD